MGRSLEIIMRRLSKNKLEEGYLSRKLSENHNITHREVGEIPNGMAIRMNSMAKSQRRGNETNAHPYVCENQRE